MKKLLAASLLFAAVPLTAMAQDTATDPTLAPPTCKKPAPKNTVRRADGDEGLADAVNKYQDCIKAYVDNQNKLANAHIAVANSAVSDANAFIKQLNDQQGQK